jgi:hypothetical protein
MTIVMIVVLILSVGTVRMDTGLESVSLEYQ